MIGANDGRPLAAHAPVLLAQGRLRFHLSNANPLCAALRSGPRALAVVTGPDAYVSPDWYADQDQVPTWNYLSCELEGPVRVMDGAETISLLDDLAGHFEHRLLPKGPWTRQKMTPARFEALLAAITGFEMTVQRLEGVAKLSQNKSADDVRSVAGQLGKRPEPGARELAEAMCEGLGRARED
ncbi:MAG: FMN-binding negative transcriptional regulator [Caulobacteraceae bacterium]